MTTPTTLLSGDVVGEAFGSLVRRRAVAMGAISLALIVSAVIDIATGPAFLPISAVVRSVFEGGADDTVDAIVWVIRLPIALLAISVGASLGLSGAIMQTILNNPLASSYTLGVSAGAGFGAALVIVMGGALLVPDIYAVPVFAFLFAGIACFGVFMLGQFRGATPESLVLAGIALLFLFQALLSLLEFVASPEALQQIVFWLFGSLQRATWTKLWVVTGVLLACLPVVTADVWRLTAMKLGDERAAGLGVRPRSVRMRAFVLISALTGVAVAFVGTIGFVGLVAPHLARSLVGEDQRGFLPAATLLGALLLSLSSIASKTIIPGAIFPIGIITSLIGVPFFVWLVIANRRAYW